MVVQGVCFKIAILWRWVWYKLEVTNDKCFNKGGMWGVCLFQGGIHIHTDKSVYFKEISTQILISDVR